MNESQKFEQAFIQCLKDGVYPGPANINERRNGTRFNRLNGRLVTQRLALMYAFGVPYQRGPVYSRMDYGGVERLAYDAGKIPDYPYFTEGDGFITGRRKPALGGRKHEFLMDDNEPWELKRR